MILDLENMDMIIVSGHYEREDSEFGNSVRRPECLCYDALIDHNSNTLSNPRENEIGGFAGNGQSSAEIDSSCDLNRLSNELSQKNNTGSEWID